MDRVISNVSSNEEGNERLTTRVVSRYMGLQFKGLKWAGIKDHSPGIWNHNGWDRDQQYFSWNQGSGIKFVRVQGSKFLSFLGSGFKIWGKNMGSVTKKYTSIRPCYYDSLLVIRLALLRLDIKDYIPKSF